METTVTTLLYSMKIMHPISLTAQPNNLKVLVIGLFCAHILHICHQKKRRESLINPFFFLDCLQSN